MAPRLSMATRAGAGGAVRRFAYDRDALRPRLVHLGLGAFFRAHGALFTEDAVEAGDGDWGIVGASLQRPDLRDRLAPQDCLYTAVEAGPGGRAARIVGAVLDVLVAPEDPERLLRRLAAPETAVVTLTITEKGYCHDPATGLLDTGHPAIRHDLEAPASPASAIGFIVEALARRGAAGLPPFTVASCDNLPGNGAVLGRLARDFAALRDDALAGWIEARVPFPSSMVDRIVPAEAPGDGEAAARLTGLEDRAAVTHEPFRQWVLEDRFVDGLRPPWERAGVAFVGDVAPHEHAKLRMLNGSHSALAYLGLLAGHGTIAETVADDVFARYVRRFWAEDVIPVLASPPGTDLARYAQALFARYANPAIRHRTAQIAMDGSQKLPQRLLSTIRDNMAQGRGFDWLALAVAAWIRHLGGADDAGRPIEARDPLLGALRARLEAAGGDGMARVTAVLGLREVFGGDLPGRPAFLAAVGQGYDDLCRDGARPTLAKRLSPG